MEFFFFKSLSLLFSPLVIIFIFLLLGWLFCLAKKRVGLWLLSLGMLLFIGFGVVPVGPNLMVYLERQYEEPNINDYLDGIVVLGGTFKTEHSLTHDRIVVNDNIERVLDAVLLNQVYPEAFLVFSGGNGILGSSKKPESQDVRRFMDEFGFSDNTVIYEDKSRNTFENARFTKDLILPLPQEQWVLVTSAYHMPRSMAVFEAIEWDIIPYPTDYRTNLEYCWWPSLTKVQENLAALDLALHEIAGRWLYKLTGKI
jgi:uncharacterized SAM-binding protein YcdF (DUF218 family)